MNIVWFDYVIIIVYTLIVLGIGVYFSRDKRTSENYLLGGRNMPFIAIGLACMMSLFSSISIVMVPGEIFNHGLTLFILGGTIGMVLPIPFYLMFTRFYFKLGSFTPYEYLEYRYDRTVRAVVAFSAFYTRVIYIGMVLYTSAKIFEASFGWTPWFSILLVATVGIAGCFLGGSKAVVWTDVFQTVIVFGGFAAVIGMLCYKIDGGAFNAVRTAVADGHGLPQFREIDFYSLSPYVRLLFWLLLWGAVITPLTNACSDQVSIQRFLSTKNWKEGFKSQIVSTASGMFFIYTLWFIGMALYTYYKQNPDPLVGTGNGDAAFFRFVAGNLPSPLSGIFMAAMLAAIMSTVSSATNSMAAVWLKEFHQKFINRSLDAAGEFRVSRNATLIIGSLAVVLALALDFSGKWLQQSVAEVGTLFYLIGAAILPAFLFAVLSGRANAKLVWCYTFFAFGEGVAMNVWYALSRSAVQAWEKDSSAGLGWGGRLDFIYVLIPLAPGLLLTAVWLVKSLRNRVAGKLAVLTGMLLLGAAEAMLLWYGYSNAVVTDAPLGRSFAFALPISFLGAFVILWFCPRQPREKYQGLTLGTLNQEVIGRKP
jgi:SSS family transporter